MEASTKSNKMHIGKKISRLREIKGIKQDHIAFELGVSQQAISKIENSHDVEDATLEKIADILGLSVEAIKNFDEEVLIFHIENMHDNAVAAYNYQYTYNPLDKVVELYDEKVALLERLLESEKEKVEILKNSVNKD